MPDITMCSGEGCPIKEGCYRYRAIPTPRRQTYFQKPPRDGVECLYLMPLRTGDKLNDR